MIAEDDSITKTQNIVYQVFFFNPSLFLLCSSVDKTLRLQFSLLLKFLSRKQGVLYEESRRSMQTSTTTAHSP